jgi:polyhydroxyalkanoate synthesis repressor PhaR
MPETHLIKKYANRRLYDTADSKHVTLDGIRDLIIAGNDVEIIDDASGEDITRSILLQIIADKEQGGRPMLDAGFLMQIIRLYGHPIQDMIGGYLLKSFETLMQQQAEYQEQLRRAVEASPMMAMQDLAASQMEAWKQMQDAMMGKKRDSDPE